MKATLATLACLLTVGFLSAAEVTGNNTAVVIRKNAVQAKNGYQFLCVPVNGLNIAGAEDGEVALETLLPAATLSPNAYVTGTKLGETDPFTYTVKEVTEDDKKVLAWTSSDGQKANVTFKGGQIFWLNTQGVGRARAVAPSLDTIVFCGQDRGLTLGDDPATSGVIAMCNDSSVAITLGELAEDLDPEQLDQILTIKAGSSEYNIYRYLGETWYGSGANNDCSEVKIAPGEAFYYYTSKSQQ